MRTGYLRLGHTQELGDAFERSVELQRSFGLNDSKVLTSTEIAAMIPHLFTGDVELGLFGPQNGFVDGHLYCSLMGELAQAQGAKIVVHQTVIGVEKIAANRNCVLTADGSRFVCDFVVNAAGPWAGVIGERLGTPLHILPEKAQAALVDLGQTLSYTMPLVMDFVPGVGGSGLNFRHERPGQLVVELHTESVSKAEDPDTPEFSVSQEFYEAVAAQLHTRLPGLGNATLGPGGRGCIRSAQTVTRSSARTPTTNLSLRRLGSLAMASSCHLLLGIS